MDHHQDSNCPASNPSTTYSCSSSKNGFLCTYGDKFTGSTGVKLERCFNKGRHSQVCAGADVSHAPNGKADVGVSVGVKYKF